MANKNIIYPKYPLSTKFIDAKQRVFEVQHVIMGDQYASLSYTIELANGWKITEQIGGNYPQTKVGFVNLANPTELIYESVENIDRFIKEEFLNYK